MINKKSLLITSKKILSDSFGEFIDCTNIFTCSDCPAKNEYECNSFEFFKNYIEQNEEKMEIDYLKLDRSKFPVMEVSNDTKCWEKRIVLFKNWDFSCRAVSECDEGKFLNNENFGIYDWKVCRPIKQKKTRYMTPLEVIQFGIDNPNVVIKVKEEDDITPISFFYSSYNSEYYEYTTLTNGKLGEWKEFLVEVE